MLFEIPETALYMKDAKGIVREWKIQQNGGDIVIHHGVVNGQQQQVRETVKQGKAARTLQQQIESRINSRINKQELKGYKRTLEEALAGRTNALGLYRPMLAQSYQKVKNVSIENSWVQMKYDGCRMLVTKQNGKLLAYSRNGKIMENIDHILNGINIPEGTTLDGECYAHGHSLQEVVSWIKRKQANTYRLEYHIYDLVSSEIFANRLEILRSYQYGQMAHLVPTQHISEIDSIQKQFSKAKETGYEGLILRTDVAGYEDGKRSKSLLKIKQFLDDEFTVIEIEKSDKNRTVVTCLARNGKTFKVSPPGTLPERLKVYDNYEFYIGKTLRIEYSVLTADGIPFHGVATEWRDKGME